MESESGAKIAIRGKGSIKEGKGRSDAAHTSNQEEDLHCLIMADTEEKVNKAKQLIHNVIETAASIPEGQNELKRNQLRELAALNGTLRDDENQACQNCKIHPLEARISLTSTGGQIGHRKYDCPEQRNFTANIICRVCGNAGHMARDCPERQRGTDARNNVPGNFGPPRGRLGPSDAVDREMEVCHSPLPFARKVLTHQEPHARIVRQPFERCRWCYRSCAWWLGSRRFVWWRRFSSMGTPSAISWRCSTMAT
jgi:splicing factor 1